MALYQRKRTPRVSEIPIKVKPFIGDHKEIMNLSTASGESQAGIARGLIAEALKARRMKAIGKDEMSREVVAVQKKAMYQSQEEVRDDLAEIKAKLEEIHGRVHAADSRVADEFERAREQTGFVILALRFVVTEVIICRHLLRDYVHTFYKYFVEKWKRPLAEVEGNFEARVNRYRAEAEGRLDELSEISVGRLHEMAGGEGSLDPSLLVRKTPPAVPAASQQSK